MTSCIGDKRFSKLSASKTGIAFTNELKATADLNIINYLYFFNGGGVGAGDLNGDGLQDLVFVSNQGENAVYLNKGELKFQDISYVLGIDNREMKWSTGIAIADVNGDGRLDLYISEVGSYLKIEGENKLFINTGNDKEGIPIFEEQAKKYGLDLVGFGTQAVFFDYDLDNDLDMYMLNHSVHSNGTFKRSDIRTESHPLAGDRLMRNDGERFTDVTSKSGIYNSALGYGLGIGISDVNQDGWPDIYVGNDFHENDYLYLNQGDGTFKESLGEMIKHTSRFSMGNDLADINNDGLIDILSLDMLPRDYEKLKSSAGEDPYDIYQYKLKYGYHDQHSRNTLQLNRGNGKFSEIGLSAGVSATDWSWSGLMADFDLDGFNDMFIANGIIGRTNDLDYINFISNEVNQQRLAGDLTEKDLSLTNKMPVVEVPNYAFRNNRELGFESVSMAWGFEQKSFSNGAVYVDLDNDGDLEIVTNNINEPAFIFKNNTRERVPEAHFLTVRFEGPPSNPWGVGARVELTLSDDSNLVRELFPVRGYQSTQPHELYFGLDSLTKADLKVTWPDGRVEKLSNVESDQTIYLSYTKAKADVIENSEAQLHPFQESWEMGFEHKENNFIEFHRESLIPGMLSAEGPAFAQGDVNEDGLIDYFFGGAKNQPSYFYLQLPGKKFEIKKLDDDIRYEDVSAVFVDHDKDGDLDLVIGSGGNEFSGESPFSELRLYQNVSGTFFRDTSAIESIFLNTSIVAPADYDLDGDFDLFVGARSVPWKYGFVPESYFLKNENGVFQKDQELTAQFGKILGMVTDAKWAHIDGNRKPDLVVASDWSTIKVVYQDNDGFSLTNLMGSEGLWNCVEVGDFDADGKLDIVAGNLGSNSKLAVSDGEILRLYVNDFDDNGSVEQIMVIEKEGREELFTTKDELVKQLNFIKKKYVDYASFAQAHLHEILPPEKLNAAIKYEVRDTRSSIFFQEHNGDFSRIPLANEAQFSSIQAINVRDFNFDGLPDIMAAGNYSRASIQRGKYDASYGEVLMNWTNREMKYIPNATHGLYLDGEIRHLAFTNIDRTNALIVVKNDAPVQVFRFGL